MGTSGTENVKDVYRHNSITYLHNLPSQLLCLMVTELHKFFVLFGEIG